MSSESVYFTRIYVTEIEDYEFKDQVFLSQEQNEIYKKIYGLMGSFVEGFDSCRKNRDYFEERDIQYMLNKMRNILEYVSKENLFNSKDFFDKKNFIKVYLKELEKQNLQEKITYRKYNNADEKLLSYIDKKNFLLVLERVYIYIRDYIKEIDEKIKYYSSQYSRERYEKKNEKKRERSRDKSPKERMNNNLNDSDLGIEKSEEDEEEEEENEENGEEKKDDDDSDNEYNEEDINIDNQREDYEKEGKKFRFNAKAVFLTYPKCTVGIHECMDFIKEKTGKVKQMVVSRELHKDGDPHLHVYAEFTDKVNTANSRYFDINGFHPYITKPKSKYFVIRYVCKKKDYEEFGINVQEFLDKEKEKYVKGGKKKGKLKKCLEDVLKDKIPLEKAVLKEPMLIMNYEKLKKNIQEWKADMKKLEREKKVYFEYIQDLKRRHYWIWGQPDAGKTTFKNQLVKLYEGNAYQIPPNNDWVGYSGEKILFYDEFEGRIDIDTMNTICDGNSGRINTKGGSKYLTTGNPLVFLFSNHKPEDCYDKIFEYDNIKYRSLMRRFNVFELRSTTIEDNKIKEMIIEPDENSIDQRVIDWLGLLIQQFYGKAAF